MPPGRVGRPGLVCWVEAASQDVYQGCSADFADAKSGSIVFPSVSPKVANSNR